MTKKSLSPEELFNQDVIKRFTDKLKIADNGCLEWTGKLNSDGYGDLSVGTRETQKKIRAHRYAFQLMVGATELPSGFSVLHHCDNPACCAPPHLFGGTHQDNMDDMVAKNRSAISFANAKTNWDVVDDIRSAPTNVTNKELSLKHDLSKSSVSEIRSGKRWKEEHREKAMIPKRS